MATIRDIAKKAGVSPGAVSRILNNDTTLHVSADTRKKVLNTAKNLNYKKCFFESAEVLDFFWNLIQKHNTFCIKLIF